MKTVALRKKAKLSKERKRLNKLVSKRKKTTDKISKLQQKKKTKKTKVGKKLVEIRENLAKKKNTRIQKKINKNPEAIKDRARGKMMESSGTLLKGGPKKPAPRRKTTAERERGRTRQSVNVGGPKRKRQSVNIGGPKL